MNEYKLALKEVENTYCDDCIFYNNSTPCPQRRMGTRGYVMGCAIPQAGIYRERIYYLVHKLTGEECKPEDVVNQYDKSL